MVNTINFSQVFKMCIRKNCDPVRKMYVLPFSHFVWGIFIFVTSNRRLDSRLNILRKCVVYQSVKLINQKWGLWKIERTHYSNALSPCVYAFAVVFVLRCIDCIVCLVAWLSMWMWNTRWDPRHILEIIPTIIGLNIWIEKVTNITCSIYSIKKRKHFANKNWTCLMAATAAVWRGREREKRTRVRWTRAGLYIHSPSIKRSPSARWANLPGPLCTCIPRRYAIASV